LSLFRILIDAKLFRENSSAKKLACLRTIDTLLANIQAHPSEEKYKKVRFPGLVPFPGYFFL
jgi:hypothetical protein